MRTIEIQLTDEAFAKLEVYASSERRLPAAQAEVFLLVSLGLWPQKATPKPATKPKPPTPKPAPVMSGDAGAR
jgi:hypothetical protein